MSASALPTNLLLLSLSPPARASLLKHATPLDLPAGTVLYEEATVPRYAWFLLSGLASVVTAMPNGESVEVGFTGREGMVSSLHLLGPASLSTRCMMQVSGSGLRVPFAEAKKAFDEVAEVRNRILEFVQEHAPRDAPVQRVALVVGKIDAGVVAQQVEHAADHRLVVRNDRGGIGGRRRVRMAADTRDFARDVVRRQDVLDATGRNRAARHHRLFGRVVLRERQTTDGADFLQSERSVAERAGQDHADRAMGLVLCE